MLLFICYGEPGGNRTPDPRLRRPVLYPAELLTHNTFIMIPHTKTNVKQNDTKLKNNLKAFKNN